MNMRLTTIVYAAFAVASCASAANVDVTGCGTTKGCLGMPVGCEAQGNCLVMASYMKNAVANTKLDMEIQSAFMVAGEYAAVGISKDGDMGEDLVYVCTGDAKLIQGWNEAGEKDFEGLPTNQQLTLEGMSNSNANGVTKCAFTIPSMTVTLAPAKMDFKLDNNSNYLLLAFGPMGGASDVEEHSKTAVSTGPVKLTDPTAKATVSPPEKSIMAKVHGLFMVLAWLSCASGGIIAAAHMKATWTDVKIAGKDLWFRLHQLQVGLAVFFALVGAIIIFADEGFFSYNADFISEHPHPATGGAVLVLAIIQPIMGALRPHPDSEYRWIFRIAHTLVGYIAWALAFTTIMLAVDLHDVYNGMSYSQSTYRILMYVFLGVWSLVHVVLAIQKCMNDKAAKESDVSPMNSDNGGAQSGDAPGSMIRQGIYYLYLLFVWIFAFILMFLIVGNW